MLAKYVKNSANVLSNISLIYILLKNQEIVAAIY